MPPEEEGKEGSETIDVLGHKIPIEAAKALRGQGAEGLSKAKEADFNSRLKRELGEHLSEVDNKKSKEIIQDLRTILDNHRQTIHAADDDKSNTKLRPATPHWSRDRAAPVQHPRAVPSERARRATRPRSLPRPEPARAS